MANAGPVPPPSPARQRMVAVIVVVAAIAIVGGLAWLGSTPEDRSEGLHKTPPQATLSSRHMNPPPAQGDDTTTSSRAPK